MKQEFAVGTEVKVGSGFIIKNEIADIDGTAEGVFAQHLVLLRKENEPAGRHAADQDQQQSRKNSFNTSDIEIDNIY